MGLSALSPLSLLSADADLKGIVPHILIKPFFNSCSEGIKAWGTKWLLTGTEVQSIRPNSSIALFYNPDGMLITYYRANKTARMLLSLCKNNTTNYCCSHLRKGWVFGGFFVCSCFQNTPRKYELKVSPLENVLIILLIHTELLKRNLLGFVIQGLCLCRMWADGWVSRWLRAPKRAWELGWRVLLPPKDMGATEELRVYLTACGTKALGLNFQFSPSFLSPLPFSSSSCKSLALISPLQNTISCTSSTLEQLRGCPR